MRALWPGKPKPMASNVIADSSTPSSAPSPSPSSPAAVTHRLQPPGVIPPPVPSLTGSNCAWSGRSYAVVAASLPRAMAGAPPPPQLSSSAGGQTPATLVRGSFVGLDPVSSGQPAAGIGNAGSSVLPQLQRGPAPAYAYGGVQYMQVQGMQYTAQSGPSPSYMAPAAGVAPPTQFQPRGAPIQQQQAGFTVGYQGAAQKRKKKKKPQSQQQLLGGNMQEGFQYPQQYVTTQQQFPNQYVPQHHVQSQQFGLVQQTGPQTQMHQQSQLQLQPQG